MSEIDALKFYADSECTQPISTIAWSNFVTIKLIDGTQKIIPNSARGGETAHAAVWIKNHGQSDFGITDISFSDSRVQVKLSEAWIYPTRPVQMILIFPMPPNPTKADSIGEGKIIVKGYFISKTQLS